MDDKSSFPIYRAAVSGMLAMLVGLGIARFGYGPLVPALVGAHWYSAAAAFWLGAINLLGYFIGAAFMRFWRGTLRAKPVIVGLMAATALSLLASALNWGMIWFGFWRLLSGITGGVLMVLMAAAVVGRAPARSKGQVSGITFAGMGVGITLSSLLIPLLVKQGLVFTWAVLGLVAVAATLTVAWLMPDATITASPPKLGEAKMNRAVLLLVTAYAGSALGFVPHMLFLSSFVAIGLQRGVAAGAAVSAWFGVAAALGPVILGRVADRFGFLPTLALGYAVMACAVALPLVNDSTFTLDLSAIGVGAVGLGGVMLAAGAIAGLVPANRLAADWGFATMAYAVMQTLTAAGFSHLFHATDSFLLLFGIGAVAVAGSAALVIGAARRA
ncbi:YbfB/YjiJ family MFS transporter [Acidocella sp.]|jgi:predicted MFS family arabinose efflux permease|uniref:YbfB/YjiJ family MFS transporter n=1 Tax=Acidocella sp. TaxID=50710 RepID=UPI002F3FBA4D